MKRKNSLSLCHLIIALIILSPVSQTGTTGGGPRQISTDEASTQVGAGSGANRVRHISNTNNHKRNPRITKDLECLALNIYFEARNEPNLGRRAVGHVVMNRVNHGGFPATVCGVVRQGGSGALNRCQFSWWCDGLPDKPYNRAQWLKSLQLALEIYTGRSKDPTSGALWFHADHVNPGWSHAFERGPKIGRHIFYRES